ncbi:MAG: hypothetical protein DRN66_00455 [Candidatus Nanohalarchaeota archaeon]|nr:MAG: hypothetical protein DRN66_00455 [Candidatus Nanohaloarchaeota archaeon]
MEKKDKFILDSLNMHGSFFHRKCIAEIAKINTFGVVEKEFPVQVNDEKTKIDIIAARDAQVLNYYVIECKKVHEDFKCWVFFPDGKLDERDVSDINIIGKSPIIIDSIFHTPLNTKKLGRYVFNHELDTKLKFCYDGYEIKLDYAKENKLNKANLTKTRKNNIENACNQVLLGTRGYSKFKVKKLPPYIKRNFFFFPLIITTAKLFTIETTSENIDLIKGETIKDSEVAVISVPWLIYNYKPNFLLTYRDVPFHDEVLSCINEAIEFTMSVFIINSEHLEEFFKEIQFMPY